MNKWLKNKLRRWLGVEENSSRITDYYYDVSHIKSNYSRMIQTCEQATAEIQDHSFQGNTRIVVASNLGQGFCKWYEFRFKDVRELTDFCEMLAYREISSQQPYIDAHRDAYGMLDEERGRRGLPKRRR